MTDRYQKKAIGGHLSSDEQFQMLCSFLLKNGTRNKDAEQNKRGRGKSEKELEFLRSYHESKEEQKKQKIAALAKPNVKSNTKPKKRGFISLNTFMNKERSISPAKNNTQNSIESRKKDDAMCSSQSTDKK